MKLHIKPIFTSLVITLLCTIPAMSADQLMQVTSESQVVSGRQYLLYYVSNANGCYVEAEANQFSVVDGHNTEEYQTKAVYYLISDGDGKWKIKSKTTDKFFPVPTAASNEAHTFTPTEEAEAGLWTLNFLAGGNVAPYCHNTIENIDYSLNRYTGVLHGWTKGEENVNQFKLYEWVGTFNADSKVYMLTGEENWMLVPARGIYYYLYNTSTHEFAYPSDSGDWTTNANIAVPLRVVRQDDTYYRLSTKDGTKTFMTNSKTDFEITESEGSIPSVIFDNLLGGYEKVDNIAEDFTDGWYALRIVEDSEHPQYDGNFLYTLDTPYGTGTLTYPYPVSHGGTYDQHPAKDDVTYYFHMFPVTRSNGTYYHWQLPNGIYIVNYLNNYPIMYHSDLSDFIIGQNVDGTYYIQSSDFRTKAFDGYIGKTARKHLTSSTKLELYKIDVAAAGLTPWKVVFNEGADNIPLTCSRDDVHGPTTVYNGGYFFLPSSNDKPVAAEFSSSAEGFVSETTEVRESDHTIRVLYAPDICFTADNVSIVQGSRTTGRGNDKQVLLRTKIVPQAPCTLKSLDITLAGAEQFDQVEAYLTTADQLHAEGVSSTLLGSKDSGLTGDSDTPLDNIYISLTTNNPVLRMNETYYLWLTADIKENATESEIVDATITGITYTNGKNADQTVDIASKGDPEGNMRIFMRQSFVRVSTENNGQEAHYYRNPAILNIGTNTVLAFCDNRYDNVNGLGKDYDGSDYGHRMDVIVMKSTDNGATWGNPVNVGTGTDETDQTQASGYAGPAVVYNGSKVICLMAKGSTAYDSRDGLTTIAMRTSTDGVTWSDSAPSEININWNGLSPTSFYVTPGKGVAYSDGHVAFVINAKVGGRLQEYLLYSNAACDTWTVDPTPLSGKGKESKIQLKNDGTSLLVMGKAPASKECNNDLLYFKRSGEGESIFDGILQTIMWKNDGTPQRLKDMRLYVSFDLATTWKELFYIQPGNGATSSMAKDSDGNLAICFEDGSIGNDEKDGCYTLTYAVIDKSMIAEHSAELNTSVIISTGLTAKSAPNVSGSGWTTSVVTNTASGLAGITISTNHRAFNREGSSQRYFIIKPSAAGASDVITITAPPGFVIKSYSITGDKKTAENYTLTAGDNTATFNGGTTEQRTLTVDNIYSPSTTFTFTSNSNTNSSYSLITDFTITLTREEYGVKLNQVNPGVPGNSYATLYTAYDLRQIDDYTKAYYITEVEDGKAVLTETANEGRDVPKNTAVLLVNSEGSTYTSFTLTEGMTPIVSESDNLLKGTLNGMTLDMATHQNYYSFGRRRTRENEQSDWGDYVAGFYNNGKSITLGANRAYLDTTIPPVEAGTSRGFDLSFYDNEGEPTTGLSTLNSQLSTPDSPLSTLEWYSLDGRKLNGVPTKKGIYINGGRKIVIK